MNRSVRASLAGLLAIALLWVVAVSPAAAAWGFPCGGAGTHVCVWWASGWGAPQAGTDGSDQSYVGDFYPNSANTINNTASSIADYYTNKDVTWHWDVNNGGFGLCVDSGMGYSSLPGFDNDQYSSHAVSLDDGAC